MYQRFVLGGCLLLATSLHAATLVVDSVQNVIAADAEYTLLEALTDAKPGDTISFNIPGPGPHFIKPPTQGFPVLTTANLTIDGYTQPGSVKNSNSIREANNSKLMIFLDCREGPRGATPFTSTGVPVVDAGDSAILLFFNSQNSIVKGLGFLSRFGFGTVDDPAISSIAYVGECLSPKIQGCWLGLHPDGRQVFGGINGINSAVIPGSVQGIVEAGIESRDLVIGTDGDGVNDRAEFNVIMGNKIDMLVSGTNTRISGNFINFYPDAKSFYVGTRNGTETFLESGKADGMIVGTDGNGVSDDNEANVMSKSVDAYKNVIEFYRTSRNIVIAGNYIGVAPDGVTRGIASGTFISSRGGTDIRVGSNFDGTSDLLEQNWIYGCSGNFLSSSELPGIGRTAIVLRGNRLVGNSGVIPIASDFASYYNLHLANPGNNYTPQLRSDTTLTSLRGTVPAPKDGTQTKIVDLYLMDPEAFSRFSSVQGKIYLKSFIVDGAEDRNPVANEFDFNTTSLNLPSTGRVELVVAAVYSLPGVINMTGATTLPFSNVISFGEILPITLLKPIKQGANLKLTWTGGRVPYSLEQKDTIDSEWFTFPINSEMNEAIIPAPGEQGYFRVRSF